MLSKAQNKYIRSLRQQKFRQEYSCFIAEGEKIAREWLESDARIQIIVAIEDWITGADSLLQKHPEASICSVAEHELEALSGLQTPNKVLLAVHMPEKADEKQIDEWCIALDNIQDPGNMGTIIRIADWFGIKYIVCSEGTVDVYNPKVVQAAMGSHLRVNIIETKLEEFLNEVKMPVLVSAPEGEDIFKMPKQAKGVLVIGNESKGVSAGVAGVAGHIISIPRRGGAESLNAAVSAGILCAVLIG